MISGFMNNARLERLLQARYEDVEGQPGFWKATVDPFVLYVVTDESHDRMRVMTPIREMGPGDTDLAFSALSANFDRALDVKYALNNGVLWSLFMHPLRCLTEGELENALEQVYRLAVNTGTSWTSSELVFGGGADDDE